MVVEAQVQVPDVEKMAKDTAQKAKQITEQTQEAVEEQHSLVADAFGKFMLASIGAVALAADSLEHLLNRMVERGELSQQDARKRMDELRARRPHLAIRRKQVSVEASLDSSDLPSKADIQALHDQIAALTAKVDQLAKEKDEGGKSAASKAAVK